ncbi:hypothetical protein LTS17_007823 [Exophiala oligosperma]
MSGALQPPRPPYTPSHHSTDYGASTSQIQDGSQASGRYAPRVRQACRACALKKLKCTDSKPCRRCSGKNIACEYDQSPEPEPLQDQSQMVVEENTADNLSVPVAGSDSHHTPVSPERNWVQRQPNVEHHVEASTSSQPMFGLPVPRTEGNLSSSNDAMSLDVLDCTFDPRDLNHPMNHMENLSSSHDVVSLDVLGCTFDLPSFGDFIQQDIDSNFGDLDLALYPDFAMTPAAQSINNHDSSNSTTLESPVMGMGTEAYQGSNVRRGWNPTPGDTNSETESLQLPSNVRSEVLSSTVHDSHLALKLDDMTLSTRDRILAMIYSRTSRSIWERLGTTFESVDVLKAMIHHALLHLQEQQMIPFIHLASFDINEQCPELLGALLAYGAVSLPSATMRKFGYAMQELVRLAVNQKLEDERASVRELGMAQAYYIQLYLGYWSGISAKIEVAESSSMLGATILRRGKMFQAGNYQPPEAFLSLEGLSLQQQWLRWAAQESWTRLVYFAMLHDAEVSLSRKLNPLFAYSEIATPLPASSKLWDAATADEWHGILMRDDQLRLHQPHAIKRVLREPKLIHQAERNIVDTSAAAAALLAGYWGLVYEYRQMEALQSGVEDWNNFVLKSRHAELTSLLEQLKMELAEVEHLRTEIVLLQELILLHLNAAYYDISAYSGRGTMEDAQAAKPYVQWWFESQQAQHAIWHAGQIFRFTKSLRPGMLSDISVIALYHATETMWVWGLMQRTVHQQQQQQHAGLSLDARGGTSSSTSIVSSSVVLDGEETSVVTRFLRLSRGQPGVTSLANHFVPLIEPASVSDLANDLIKGNWGSQILPWTTSEVSRLVQGFSKICRRRLTED